ncbi:MAG: glycosyltransferase family 9 protein [Gemmatimonadaceae bacterium]|jgi:ADP-heptose:LPS heptosyltransferase
MELKRIEVAWRAFWMKAIALLLPGPRKARIPDWDARPMRLLYLRFERIGDLIMATAAIRAIKQAHPRFSIDVLVTPTNAPVLENNPHVSEVLFLNGKARGGYARALRAVQRRGYDVVVDGRLNKPPIFTSAPLVMLASRAEYRVGAAGGRADLVYNLPAPEYDKRTNYMEASRALCVPFGIDCSAVDWRPEIFLTDAERRGAEERWGDTSRRRLLVNLSTSELKRRWPDEHFVAALKFVRARDAHINIGVSAVPSEWDSVVRIAGEVGAVALPTPKLRDALAVVATTDLVFTPDTGISHAASAFNRPAVVFMPADFAPYAPYDIPGELVFWPGSSIDSLKVEDVIPALGRLLDGFPSVRRAARQTRDRNNR